MKAGGGPSFLERKSVSVRRRGLRRAGNRLTFSLSPRFSGGKLRLEVEEALEIVSEGDERPFEADLGQAAQRKAAKAHRLFDDPKDRFDRLLSLLVTQPSGLGGDAMGHLLDKRRVGRPPGRSGRL